MEDIDDLPKKNQENYTSLTPLWFLERAAAVHPTRISIVHGSIRHTWLQLYHLCRRFAFALSSRSIDAVYLLDDIISKAFQGRNGRAFLFSHGMNVEVGPKEDRHLMTILYIAIDIYCADCRLVLGWKYLRAYESSQNIMKGSSFSKSLKLLSKISIHLTRSSFASFIGSLLF
ncbi:hypothetical protein RDABS01_011187 [Bienertia sinuspersici]